jgi:hypothetical protein
VAGLVTRREISSSSTIRAFAKRSRIDCYAGSGIGGPV